MRRYQSLFILVPALLMGVIACGSSSTASVPRGYAKFSSDVFPYMIGYPTAWRVQPGDRAKNSCDGFFPPNARPGTLTTVVVCAQLYPARLSDYVYKSLSDLKVLSRIEKQRAIMVGAHNGWLIQSSIAGAYYDTMAVTVAGGDGWQIELRVSTRIDLGLYQNAFRQMLTTFAIK